MLLKPARFPEMIKVSIPGKIHLIGEHSVVYGFPAILASINLFLHAKISKSKRKEILGITQYDDAIKNMQSAIEKKISEKFNVKKIPNYIADNHQLISGYKIEINKSKIPVGSGLGTSASLSIAFTICLLKFFKIKYSKKDIYEIAFEGEKLFHGNPSGGDLYAVLNKGLIYFKKTDKKTKTALKLNLPENLRKFLLIDSGKPVESTAEMVRIVSSQYKVSTIKFKKIFKTQGKLVEEMILALKTGDQEKFIQIIKKTEKNLEELGVVGKNAKKIIKKIEALGGAGKITGAGGVKKGSGMILAFHEDLKKLIKFAKSYKLRYYPVNIFGQK